MILLLGGIGAVFTDQQGVCMRFSLHIKWLNLIFSSLKVVFLFMGLSWSWLLQSVVFLYCSGRESVAEIAFRLATCLTPSRWHYLYPLDWIWFWSFSSFAIEPLRLKRWILAAVGDSAKIWIPWRIVVHALLQVNVVVLLYVFFEWI